MQRSPQIDAYKGFTVRTCRWRSSLQFLNDDKTRRNVLSRRGGSRRLQNIPPMGQIASVQLRGAMLAERKIETA